MDRLGSAVRPGLGLPSQGDPGQIHRQPGGGVRGNAGVHDATRFARLEDGICLQRKVYKPTGFHAMGEAGLRLAEKFDSAF